MEQKEIAGKYLEEIGNMEISFYYLSEFMNFV